MCLQFVERNDSIFSDIVQVNPVDFYEKTKKSDDYPKSFIGICFHIYDDQKEESTFFVGKGG
jgi:hypothetical protein